MLQVARVGKGLGSGGEGDRGGFGDGISISSGGDRRKRNRLQGTLIGDADRLTMTARESFGFVVTAITINWADGMDDVFGGKTTASRDDGLAGGKASDFGDDLFALRKDGRTAGAMNGAVDASAAEERGIGGVDDGVGGFARDVGRTVEGNGFVGFEDQTHSAEMSVIAHPDLAVTFTIGNERTSYESLKPCCD